MSTNGEAGVRSLQAELDAVRDENVELFAAGVAAYDRERRNWRCVPDDDPVTKARLRHLLSLAKVVREMMTPP